MKWTILNVQMRFSTCNLLLRGQLKTGRKKIITVDQVALPQTETFFFRSEENMKKQITPYYIIYY